MEKQNFKKYDEIRGFIAANGSKFMTIEFIKKDGSKRKMNFNPYGAAKHTKGDTASESAQQAVATRKANNPNLLNIWEQNNPDDETKFRSINMDTVYRIACGRKEIRYL